MLRVALSGIFCATAFISFASAADLAAPAASYKDTSDLPVLSWTGFYGGVNGGYGWSGGSSTLYSYLQRGASRFTSPEASYDKNGEFGGGQIGYNRQWGSFVFGVETDIQAGNIGGSGVATVIVPSVGKATVAGASTLDWFGTVRSRVGYTYENALFYVTGGFAYGGAHGTASVTVDSVLGSGQRNEDLHGTPLGYVLGGGAEYAVSPAWSIKAEYQHIDFKSRGADFSSIIGVASVGGGGNSNQDYNTVRLGLNYHLLPGYDPLN